MADEVKKAGLNTKSLAKLILGIVVLLAGILLTARFFWAFKIMIAGCLGPFLILAGLIIVAIAKE